MSTRPTGLTAATMNSSSLRWLRCLVVGGLLAAGMAAAEPAPLRVGEQGRMLVDPVGRPVFLLADTAWSLALRLTREDAEFYLRRRQAQRFNAVTFVLFAPGRTELNGSLANAYGDEAFESAGGRPDPTRPRLTPGADPADAAQYDYWDHADHLVGLARRLGLYVILLPTWGSGVVGSYNGKDRTDIVFDAANAHPYGRWVAARYRDEPHLIWMLGGDRAAVEGPNDYRPVFRALAAGVREGAPGGLISYHPRKAAPQSGAFFHADAWLAFNSVQDWPEKQIGHMTDDWVRVPAKPTWLFEGRYEGYWKNNYKSGDWGEWQVRQQAYQTVFAGAFGHTYGHERVFGFGHDGVDWKAHLDSPGARSMTHLAALFGEYAPDELLHRVPDPDLLAGDVGQAERTTSTRSTALRSFGGRWAMVYSASGRPVRVRLDRLTPHALSARWFNPRNGHWHVDGRETPEPQSFARDLAGGAGAAPRTFTPPSSGVGQDWVLVLSGDPRI